MSGGPLDLGRSRFVGVRRALRQVARAPPCRTRPRPVDGGAVVGARRRRRQYTAEASGGWVEPKHGRPRSRATRLLRLENRARRVPLAGSAATTVSIVGRDSDATARNSSVPRSKDADTFGRQLLHASRHGQAMAPKVTRAVCQGPRDLNREEGITPEASAIRASIGARQLPSGATARNGPASGAVRRCAPGERATAPRRRPTTGAHPRTPARRRGAYPSRPRLSRGRRRVGLDRRPGEGLKRLPRLTASLDQPLSAGRGLAASGNRT